LGKFWGGFGGTSSAFGKIHLQNPTYGQADHQFLVENAGHALISVLKRRDTPNFKAIPKKKKVQKLGH
jgi:hypothetical protein